ncbi:hypothetical protein EJ110_NYTH15888 [Nymphaea thermarum]|nr:hypothetical protein EJ110_NYTH15888 [Nymphaea thermarum]
MNKLNEPWSPNSVTDTPMPPCCYHTLQNWLDIFHLVHVIPQAELLPWFREEKLSPGSDQLIFVKFCFK